MKGTNASSAAVLVSSKKRRRGWLAQPVRQFDANIGAITARESNAVAPSVARIATVDAMAPEVRPRRYFGDIQVPARTLPPGPSHQQEDAILSAFLLPWVRDTLGQSTIAGRCPWCASEQTTYHTLKRPSGLPGFKCRGCLGYFSRVTKTPLLCPQARVLVHRFVPMLGWRHTAELAARELGIKASLVRSWVLAWRRHLLMVDPSGAMEARGQLGLPIKVPLPHRIRAAQRKRWLTRAWRRGADGCSYLPADGFWVKVGEAEHGWCYEVRTIGVGLNLNDGSAGFGSRDEARLAAFDFITGLLPDLADMAPVSLLEEAEVSRRDAGRVTHSSCCNVMPICAHMDRCLSVS